MRNGYYRGEKSDHYYYKTTCLGSKKGITGGRKGDHFRIKTTCFTIAKAYVGKYFPT